MTKRPGAKVGPTARLAIYERDNYTCQYCYFKLTVDQITLDHILPKALGGTNVQTNLVVSCEYCNSLKGDQIWPLGHRANQMDDLMNALKSKFSLRV